MSTDIYTTVIPLLQISKKTIQLKRISANDLLPKSERKQAKKNAKKLADEFNKRAAQIIIKLLREKDSKNLDVSVAIFLEDALFDILSSLENDGSSEFAENDLSIRQAIKHIKPIAEKHERKSPTRRRIERASPMVAIAIAAIVYFGVRWNSAIPINVEILERSQLINSLSVLTKSEKYDANMDTKVRRGGFFKEIIFWPVKPTEKEVDYLLDGLILINAAHDYLAEEGLICDPKHGSELTQAGDDARVEYAKMVQEFIVYQTSNPSAIEATFEAVADKYPCI